MLIVAAHAQHSRRGARRDAGAVREERVADVEQAAAPDQSGAGVLNHAARDGSAHGTRESAGVGEAGGITRLGDGEVSERAADQSAVDVIRIAAVDGEVGAYIVSILLPLVAAGDPTAGDLVAYGLCGVLILCVAYVSNLALVNPLIYFLGYRVARATVDGERTVVLIKKSAELAGDVTVVRAVGVTFIPDQ